MTNLAILHNIDTKIIRRIIRENTNAKHVAPDDLESLHLTHTYRTNNSPLDNSCPSPGISNAINLLSVSRELSIKRDTLIESRAAVTFGDQRVDIAFKQAVITPPKQRANKEGIHNAGP